MPIVTRAYEHTAHTGPALVGTSAIRVLAAAGWLGSAVCYTVAAIALSKSYRHITTVNWKAAIDEIGWLLPLMVSSFAMAYLGWVVWSTLAAINGHRVAPLASSPWLPPIAYLFGPAAAAAGSIYKPGYDLWFIGGAVAWVCVGHGVVLLSLRSSARRIGADAYQFTKLLWFPLASLGYRMIATMVLPENRREAVLVGEALEMLDARVGLGELLAQRRDLLHQRRDRGADLGRELRLGS